MPENVYWDPEFGAVCPRCGGKKVPVTSSPPWSDGMKVRFHKCQCGERFKSVQMSREAMQERLEKLEEVAERAKGLEEEAVRLNRILNYA